MRACAKRFCECPAQVCVDGDAGTLSTHTLCSHPETHKQPGGMAGQDTVMTCFDSISTNNCILPGILPRVSKKYVAHVVLLLLFFTKLS